MAQIIGVRGARTAFLLTTILVFRGCAHAPPEQSPPQSGLGTAEFDLGSAPDTSAPLDRKAIVIDEASFQRLLSARRDASPTFDARHAGAGLAALLGDDTTLGVFAKLEQRPARVKSSLWVVLRDPSLTGADQVQGRDMFVAAVPLTGVVPWHGKSAYVAFHETGPRAAACELPSRGCRPSFQATAHGAKPLQLSTNQSALAGLSADTILNLESASGPPNGSGHRPRLKIFPARGAPNEFECRLPVAWDACKDFPRANAGPVEKAKSAVPLPAGALLLSERDFLTALAASESQAGTGIDAPMARQILTLANNPDAVGVTAQFRTGQPFEGSLFVVARDPRLLPDGRVHAHEYYLASTHLKGMATWQGAFPEVGFRGDLPTFVEGDCGLITSFTPTPGCNAEFCDSIAIPTGVALSAPALLAGSQPDAGAGVGGFLVEPGEPRFGTDRWPGNSRVTLRVLENPGFGKRNIDIRALACSTYRPQPERVENPGGCGNHEVEICNGIDDDCDFDVDEGGVCADRSTECTCAPVTCAQVGASCGMIPDGCGQLLSCGAPCR